MLDPPGGSDCGSGCAWAFRLFDASKLNGAVRVNGLGRDKLDRAVPPSRVVAVLLG
jgi:hypothetical protein